MDNVPIHKVAGVREAIEARGAILIYLPAYSPEQVFAKLKTVLRKIAAYTLRGAAYSIKHLCKTIAACLDEISRAECAAYFTNSGYGQPKRKTL
jgi:transposase